MWEDCPAQKLRKLLIHAGIVLLPSLMSQLCRVLQSKPWWIWQTWGWETIGNRVATIIIEGGAQQNPARPPSTLEHSGALRVTPGDPERSGV